MNEKDKALFNSCIDDLLMYSQLLMSINPEQKVEAEPFQKVGCKLNEICSKLVGISNI